MSELPKRDGQGETEANTESREEEAKGGEKMQKINREDVVQAALKVERWCAERCTNNCEPCDCPFAFGAACVASLNYPKHWGLEKFLRTRGLKDGSF